MPFTAYCNPELAVIPHGGTANVKFVFFGGGRGKPVFGKLNSPKKGPGFGVNLNPTPNQQGVPVGFTKMTGFSFTSTHVHEAPVSNIHVIRFTFTRRGVSRSVTCRIGVTHGPRGRGRGRARRRRNRSSRLVKCKDRCGGAAV